MKLTIYTCKIRVSVAALSLALQSLGSDSAFAQADRVHFGFIYPISTHGTHAPKDTNDFSINVLSGVSAEERGLAFAGFSSVVKNNIKGLAFAGFSNHAGAKAEGLLFAGFINTYRSGKGAQFAGFGNVAAANVEGAQYAGFFNTAADVRGAQFGGFSNVARDVKGSQLAGFMNKANKVSGSQLAGFTNINAASEGGNQVAGFANISAAATQNQVAGFINVARKVKGVQISGFINVADSSDYPIGIVNIIRNGEKSLGVSMDETQTVLLNFRSGGKVLYGIIGGGYNFKHNDKDNIYAFEAGLGAHLLKLRSFRIHTELATTTLEDFKWGYYFKSSFRLLPAVTIAKHFEIFAGPTINYLNTNTSDGKNLVNHYFYSYQNKWSDDFQAFYIGYAGGLNIKF